MNFITPQSPDSLFSEAESENLYLKLIEQINKDFNLANEGVDFPLSTTPGALKVQLYIIDVSEEQIKKLDGSDLVALSEQVAFLILKREWQKVWFRNKL
jgi:hypothetical protein